MAIDLNNSFAVILSGGSGTRFWPRSTRKFPKQLCKISNPELSMLEETLKRLDGFIPPERRIIVTHKDQLPQTQEIVGAACGHFIAEPESRNTAPALTLAALEVKKLAKNFSEALIFSLHADHVIKDPATFIEDLKCSAKLASRGYLSLLGIKAAYPETGYGYIERGSSLGDRGFAVASFREKPSLEVAQQYVAQKHFFWNSGIFVWQASKFLSEVEKYIPEVYHPLVEIYGRSAKELATVYSQVPKIAIDQGLLEKSKDIGMIEADFSWMDMGHWAALAQHFGTDSQDNLQIGKSVMINSTGSTVYTDDRFVATIGVKDIIVVSTKNGILVCHKDQTQEVKKVVDYLQAEKMEELY